MKLKDLRDKILGADGVLRYRDIELYHQKDADIDIKADGYLLGWISSSNSDNANVVENISLSHDILKHIDALIQLAQFLDIPVGDVEPVTKEVHVQDKAKEEYMSGKVDAYEKLLIGRGVNISK